MACALVASRHVDDDARRFAREIRGVDAVAAAEGGIAVVAEHDVVAVAAVGLVEAAAAVQRVVAVKPVEQVVAIVAPDDVVELRGPFRPRNLRDYRNREALRISAVTRRSPASASAFALTSPLGCETLLLPRLQICLFSARLDRVRDPARRLGES
jgi:hypothetical protein